VTAIRGGRRRREKMFVLVVWWEWDLRGIFIGNWNGGGDLKGRDFRVPRHHRAFRAEGNMENQSTKRSSIPLPW
jgi:hypothetical protein